MRRAEDLCALGTNLSLQTTTALDVSDIFRAAYVLGVSALDYLIHEVCRRGMLEIASGARPRTEAYNRFPIALSVSSALASTPGVVGPLDDAIREKHSFLSFQQPDKIADAIRLVSSKKLWEEVASLLGDDSKIVKGRLSLIVDRRNKIAHEADMEPTVPNFRWPISDTIVRDALATISSIAEAIFTVVTTP